MWTWGHVVDVQCLKQLKCKFMKTNINLLDIFWVTQTFWNFTPAKSLSFQLDCSNFQALNAAPYVNRVLLFSLLDLEGSDLAASCQAVFLRVDLQGWNLSADSRRSAQPTTSGCNLIEMTQQRFSRVAFHAIQGCRDNPGSLCKINALNFNQLLTC